jgi:nitric oxide reductase NorE protein
VSRPQNRSAAEPDLPDFLWVEDEDQRPLQPSPKAATVVDHPTGHTPGEAGLWVFILGDMTLFGAIFVVFISQRRADRAGFKESAAQLIQPIGAVNTLVLLLSSYLVVLAVFAHRRAQHRTARRLVLAAMACAATFAGLKAVEYSVELSAGHTPATGSFFTFYFVLTGLHLLHVFVGTALLSAWTVMLRRRRPWVWSRRAAEGIAVYWHMVDLLWIAIFALAYLVCAE